MSILDGIDGSDGWLASLLGGGASPVSAGDLSSGAMAAPQQSDPADSGVPQGVDPRNLMGGSNYMIRTAGRRPGLQIGQPPDSAQAAPAPRPDLPPQPAPAPPQPMPPQQTPQPAVPMPPQRPPSLVGGDDPTIGNGPQPAPTTDISARAVTTAPPTGPAPAPTRNDGLFSQLSGIAPAKPDLWGQTAAGIGKGLSAVGSLPRGASAGQAFAAGAGGAMQGSYAAGQKENEEFFKNTIAADNQVMKGKKFPHDIAHEDASTNYLNSGVQQRLQNAALGPMGKVYGSWLQSDVGRMKLADQAFDAQEKRTVQYLQEKNKAGIDTTKDWQQMEESRDQRRADVYKRYGISDPNNFKGSQKNPIDATSMTPEQIERAPEGTYFKYTGKDGKTVIAPRDYNAHPNRWVSQAATTGTNDYAATQAALQSGGAQ